MAALAKRLEVGSIKEQIAVAIMLLDVIANRLGWLIVHSLVIANASTANLACVQIPNKRPPPETFPSG
jgi:hypothetical protein